MTDRYAVIGNPISHSKSPQIHLMFAKQTGENISYEAIKPPVSLAETIDQMRNDPDYKGCNVTVPYKHQAYKLSDEFTFEVGFAHAANTLEFQNGRIKAHNTDGIGLLRDIEQNLHINIKNKKILLLGAGGAAKGAATAIASLHSGASLVIANRTVERALELARTCSPLIKARGISYVELRDESFDVIINATSAELTNGEIPLPETIFAPGALAYDLMYGRETLFMKFALMQGIGKELVVDGLGMLVEQAAESFFIWRGIRPETASVIAALRQS